MGSTLRVLAGASVALVLSLAGAPSASAQAAADSAAMPADTSNYALARRFLEVSGTAEMALYSIREGIAMQREMNPEMPKEFWEELSKRIDKEVGTLVERFVPVYAAEFDPATLEALTTFMASPTGQRLARAQPRLNTAILQIASEWGMALGMAIAEDLEAWMTESEKATIP